ncbi:MAG: 30S ribosome-binding factor RbfA [Phycisphaeraceae bacterium]|nr:30S ribosome-binding factor RbfA [Phycisphaeraceae bacterium]
MSRRTQQVASLLERAISEVIARGLADPRIRGLISVTRVTVSEDLRQSTVYVSVFPEAHEQLALHGLQDAAKHIRREAGERVSLVRMPGLAFKLDHSLKRQAQVDQALSRARYEVDRTANNGNDGSGIEASNREEPGA